MARGRGLSWQTGLTGAAWLCGLAACWVIPYRLYTGGSWHTFGYIGDEYTYAYRIQPLLDGATAANPVNGVGDSRVISLFFLEDLCRAFLSLTGMDVITFFWLWRILFPVLLAVLFYFLARACLPVRHRIWGRQFVWAAGAAGLPALYLFYDLTVSYPPLGGWIGRIPTGIEYALSLLLAIVFVRFLRALSLRSGCQMVLVAAGLAYLRPYAALPWFLAIGFGSLGLIVTRQLAARIWLRMAALLFTALLPLILIVWRNGQLSVVEQQLCRYTAPEQYRVSPWLPLYLYCGFLFIPAFKFVQRRYWPLLAGAALALAALPFISGLLRLAHEILAYERFGVFYLVALLTALMLAAGKFSASWSGKRGLASARHAILIAAGFTLVHAGILGHRNSCCVFPWYACTPYGSVAEDLPFVPAYEWVAAHTPSRAVFLVDDGCDWSNPPESSTAFMGSNQAFIGRNDLFLIVAKRRVIYTERLYGCYLRNDELALLAALQHATLGAPCDFGQYRQALRRFPPGYILWRKKPPPSISAKPNAIPRGLGLLLLKYLEQIVYEDDYCEIWKMNIRD